jgi:hypothetical protein
VWIVVLENTSYETTFGPDTQAPYLAHDLPAQGALLSQYYATGHASLDNYIAMISGQSAAPDTDNDCQTYSDFALTGMADFGQAIGNGCVYPATVKTLADQLASAHLSWKGYMEDMGNDPARESARCGHPAVGSKDLTQRPEAPSAAVPQGDQYASRHDPFVYFHSVIDSPACAANVVGLAQLTADLKSTESTPNFSFVTPNLCHDGHDGGKPPTRQCVNGEPGGLISADAFLKTWVPLIVGSPAFKRDGLLIVTFDEGGYSTRSADNGKQTVTFQGASCCGQLPGPNIGSFPQTTTVPGSSYQVARNGFGGDRVGAVLVSTFIKGGTVSKIPYNHYSLLKSLEDIFQLSGHLGYAGQPGLAGFGADVAP